MSMVRGRRSGEDYNTEHAHKIMHPKGAGHFSDGHSGYKMKSARLVFVFLLGAFTVEAVEFPEWCVVPPSLHVLQNETCATVKNYSSEKVEIYAMRGEQEDKQLLLDLRHLPTQYNLTSAFTIKFQDLKMVQSSAESVSNNSGAAIVGAASFSWWQVGYVYCQHTTRYADSGGGWRPDPLLVDNQYKSDDGTTIQGILLESGVTQPIWISVRVPYGTPAGKYTGSLELTIRLAESNVITQNVDIELTVWNIDLPTLNASKFPAIFSFNPQALVDVYGNDTMKWKYYDLYIDQRMGGDNLYTEKPTNITLAAYLAQKGVQWLSLMDVYGVATGAFESGETSKPFPWGRSGLKAKGSCLNFTDDLVQKAINILTPIIEEYENKSLLDSMFVYGFDEAPQTCEGSIRNIYSALKKKWPKLRTVAVLNWLPSLDLPLDVWILQYENFNEADAEKWLATGKQHWWYHCIEPSGVTYLNTFIERPLMEARLLFWLAASYNVGGWLYYSDFMWHRHPPSSDPMKKISNTARTDFDPANYIWLPRTDIFANGDGNFVYPGVDGPIQTVRLRNLRDGFEDIELFRMLAVAKVKGIVSPVVSSATSYVLDPLALDKGRQQAAAALLDSSN